MLANNYIHKQYCIKDFNIASFSHLRTKKSNNLKISRDFTSLNDTYVFPLSAHMLQKKNVFKKKERETEQY